MVCCLTGLLCTVVKPVKVNGRLLGVAGVDVPLEDLLADALTFGRSESYVFVISNLGTAFAHPLLPKQKSENVGSVDIHIADLQKHPEIIEKVFDKMMQQQDGNITLNIPAVFSRGHTGTEGINVRDRNVTFHFRKVSMLLYFGDIFV